MRRSPAHASLFDVPHEEVDHLVDGEVVGVDHKRNRNRPQWRHRPLGIEAVPGLHLSTHHGGIDPLPATLELAFPPAHLLVQARGQEEFVVRVGKYDGADITACHHHAVASKLSLLRDQRLAHARVGRYARQGFGEVGVVNPVGQLHPVRPHALAVHCEVNQVRELSHRVSVAGVDAALGCDPGDGAVHEAAVDEREAKPLGDPLADRRLPGRHTAVDGDDHGGSIRTARCRASTSASPRTRQSPVFKRPSFNGPNPVRRNDCTLWPTACSIRRTWRWRPSRMTTRSSVWPEPNAGSKPATSTSAGAVLPSSRSTPLRSSSRSLALGLPATTATYSLATLYRGCVSRNASSPSSVSTRRPLVSASRRPTGKSRCPDRPSSPTASSTVVRDASSFAVVITPTGLLSIR